LGDPKPSHRCPLTGTSSCDHAGTRWRRPRALQARAVPQRLAGLNSGKGGVDGSLRALDGCATDKKRRRAGRLRQAHPAETRSTARANRTSGRLGNGGGLFSSPAAASLSAQRDRPGTSRARFAYRTSVRRILPPGSTRCLCSASDTSYTPAGIPQGSAVGGQADGLRPARGWPPAR